MGYRDIYIVVFFEVLTLLAVSIGITSILVYFLSNLIDGINISSVSDELVVAFGGPFIRMHTNYHDILLFSVYIFSVCFYSAFAALRKFFKNEIREISVGI